MKGYLVLSTGDVFEGQWFGDQNARTGEVVFTTGMTGYQDVFSDPTYAGQIVTFTYPLIGNYGMQEWDAEQITPACKGLIVGDLCDEPSHYQAKATLREIAEKLGVAGLSGVDTRAITLIVRNHGQVYGRLTLDPEEAKQAVPVQPAQGLVAQVSVKEAQSYGSSNTGPKVALVDFGYKSALLDSLLRLDCQVTVVPYNVTLHQLEQIGVDGVVLSNGPGDPKELKEHLSELKSIVEKYPTMGIGLGHQLIAIIFGADTAALPCGHRGTNYPVKDLDTGKVFITAQNHRYVVKEESLEGTPLRITFRNINDQTTEGVEHESLPVFSVQFYPEPYGVPTDTTYLFQKFVQQCQGTGEKSYA